MPKEEKTKTKARVPDTLGRQLETAFNLHLKGALRKLKGELRAIGQKHIDCSVTLGNQSLGTFENIEQELMATFPELHEEELGLGAWRLRLSVLYIKTYFNSQFSRPSKNTKEQLKIKSEITAGKSESQKSEDMVSTTTTPIDTTSSLSSSSESRPAYPASVSDTAPEIKTFLESFTPSLLYLHPTILDAGLVDQEALDAVAAWPRSNIREFLSGLPERQGGEGKGKFKLRKVVVEAIVLRLKGHEYEY
ncbi:hypothetical protein B0H12DRAFT_1141327 [Mycena haematopus]|nr:hypothetical protein B0H12DRAFT_1141327 [Mycena haematopus]